MSHVSLQIGLGLQLGCAGLDQIWLLLYAVAGTNHHLHSSPQRLLWCLFCDAGNGNGMEMEVEHPTADSLHQGDSEPMLIDSLECRGLPFPLAVAEDGQHTVQYIDL